MKRILIENAKAVKAVAPQASATDVNGAVIDRDGAREAVIALATGAATGTPSTVAVKAVITHGSLANGSDQAAVTGLNGVFESEAIGANGEVELHVDLEGLKRYIRVTADITLTGGSTPTVNVAATATLGNYDINPAHRGDGTTLVYGEYAGK